MVLVLEQIIILFRDSISFIVVDTEMLHFVRYNEAVSNAPNFFHLHYTSNFAENLI
jgi:hypothetical protein